MRLILIIVLLVTKAYAFSVDYAMDIGFRKERLPDFCLAPAPIELSDSQAVGCFLQFGRQTFRSNATYGFCTQDGFAFKVSGEYLTQKLGFSFLSGRSHRWVAQGAGGAVCWLPIPLKTWDHVELGVRYACSASRKFISKGYEGILLQWGIGGSQTYGLSAGTCIQLWSSGTISPKIVYDWVFFRRHLQSRRKKVQGMGFGITLEQQFGHFATLQAGMEFRNPYIFYHATLNSPLLYFGSNTFMAIYAERVQGLHHIPSSSRIGVELGFAFGRLKASCCNVIDTCPSPVANWVATPAVYMPQVLVTRDQKLEDFSSNTPQTVDDIGVITMGPGFFQFDISPYFSQEMTVIYGASNLPPGFQINALTGVITGMVDGSITGSYEVLVFATNYSGRAAQSFTLVFP